MDPSSPGGPAEHRGGLLTIPATTGQPGGRKAAPAVSRPSSVERQSTAIITLLALITA